MWQAEWVASQLRHRGKDVELVPVSTRGDTSTASLSQIGGQGLFTKEIQHALLAETVDVAVHSLKDLPTLPVDGLVLAAVPERETTLDCLISRNGERFEELSAGATIGTGSRRRGAQLIAWRADVEIRDIRGNVDSRLRKLEEGQYDAIVLAAAGLSRLQLYHRVSEELPQQRVLPAVGQGALGLECRSDDLQTRQALEMLDDDSSHAAVEAERSLLFSLLAGCLAPVAALAHVQSDQLHLRARVLAPDGSRCINGERFGHKCEAREIGQQLARSLQAEGAQQLIDLASAEGNERY